jgi:hypothetical protein
MKLETAIKVLQKECEFSGVIIQELMADITTQKANFGYTNYPQKVEEAAKVFETEGNYSLL